VRGKASPYATQAPQHATGCLGGFEVIKEEDTELDEDITFAPSRCSRYVLGPPPPHTHTYACMSYSQAPQRATGRLGRFEVTDEVTDDEELVSSTQTSHAHIPTVPPLSLPLTPCTPHPHPTHRPPSVPQAPGSF
jgi:hypothetical protein